MYYRNSTTGSLPDERKLINITDLMGTTNGSMYDVLKYFYCNIDYGTTNYTPRIVITQISKRYESSTTSLLKT